MPRVSGAHAERMRSALASESWWEWSSWNGWEETWENGKSRGHTERLRQGGVRAEATGSARRATRRKVRRV